MVTSAKDMVVDILAKDIDKKEAIDRFNDLADEERTIIVESLKAALQDKDEDRHAERIQWKQQENAATKTLTSVHESNLSEEQLNYIEDLTRQYNERVPKSKHNALVHQTYFVDQRKVAGLHRTLKSLQYQLTYDRAEGPYIYDIDGNKYVDITGDNGVNFFGHQPEFIKKALVARLDQGYPLVAYSEDLFEAARLICELTGHERMVFAQTGTEAVMWAVRIARAATGKKKIVIFDGSYHGLSDTILALKGRNGVSIAAGLGLLQEFADQLIVLDYGNMDHIDVIEKNAGEVACVLTEPIQSRFPSRQPHEFVKDLRKVTLENNIVLIFDEMVTGFRAGTKGAEGFFNVKPDIATYGKIPGGGMPTGIVAGLAKYMNYVDGGTWAFDNDEMPSIKRAVIGGTHTQNSLKVSATLAVCNKMKQMCKLGADCDYYSCTCAVGELNRKTKLMCEEINAYFLQKKVPLIIEYFSSLFRFRIIDDPYGLVRELFIILLKTHGIETSTSGNCFLTLSHGDDDIHWVVDGFKKSVDTLVEHRFFYEGEPEELVVQPAKAPVTKTQLPIGREREKKQMDVLRELIKADLRSIHPGVN